MQLFDVYPLNNITPVKAQDCKVWDDQGIEYLDLYGGHAVISIGHSHPHYIESINSQLNKIGFYSNSVKIPQQQAVADLLGKLSGYDDYQFFFVNSGAEANENAIKLASFATQRKKVVAFNGAFHGRTSGTVAATHNAKIVAPFNAQHEVIFLPLNDIEAAKTKIDNTVAAIIIEGIQGVGGIQIPTNDFLVALEKIAKETGALLILDEVQSGYGRTGKFFAHQHSPIHPDIITVAKGMGNGFPVGGVLIAPLLKPWHGMLGTTFGGNYLACAASLAVLEIIEQENLLAHTQEMGDYLMQQLQQFSPLKNIRGKGLMIGFDVDEEHKDLRHKLLYEKHIFTGNAGSNTIRLLPPLTITKTEIDYFIQALTALLP